MGEGKGTNIWFGVQSGAKEGSTAYCLWMSRDNWPHKVKRVSTKKSNQ